MPKTPMITDLNRKAVPGSIALLEKKKIGDVDQWLLMRGKSIDNPILLFLHGGPGSAEWPLVRRHNSELENHFIIAYWEQRGAGKTFRKGTPGLNVAQFISDTREIIEYLQMKFTKNKVFVFGHSWGSLIGILTAQKYPELFCAYIGTGQYVNGTENEEISYQYVMDTAIKTNNKKAVKQLKGINYPEPYGTIDPAGKWFRKLILQREWLFKLGGCIYQKTSYFRWVWPYFHAPEYTVKDLTNWYRGYYSSIKAMWPEIIKYDLSKQVPKLEVPVYFLIGKLDFTTPSELVERYFSQLEAPKKELIWFDGSAHNPIYEEPKKFNDVLIEIKRRNVDNDCY